MQLDSGKMRKIASALFKEPELEGMNEIYVPCIQLACAAKVVGIVPSGIKVPYSKGLVPDTSDMWEQLAYNKDIDSTPLILQVAHSILITSVKQSLDGLIDFDDQLYMPVCFGAAIKKYPRVMVDEAQDLNPIQHILVEKSTSKTGRIMAVGDPYQSVYGFRGAVSNSMEALAEKFDMVEYPLSCSFRCPKAVVLEAKKIVRHIESFPEAKEGSVEWLLEWDPTVFKVGDAVVCRYNAPLVSLAYQLIDIGMAPYMLGRDLGAGLKFLINKISNKKKTVQIHQLREFLQNWFDLETRNALAKEDDRKVTSIEDRYNSLLVILGALKDNQIARDALKEVDRIFNAKTGNVTLSSIHRAKGLEWPRVYFLNRSAIPHRYTAQKAIEGLDWAIESLKQEDNLVYVAITRAKDELIYIEEDKE